jgi:hypothetical protein
MAHFAEIDKDNVVLRVLVVDNSEEKRGQDFLAKDLGLGGTWIQTSYNNNIRGNFAAIGNVYNKSLDIFELSEKQKLEAFEIQAEIAKKEENRAAIIEKLGITQEEAKLLLY